MEREIYIPPQLHPNLPQALRLATEAQRLVEVAKTQRQSAEAKVGATNERQEGLTMRRMMQCMSKWGGNIAGSWMVFFQDLTHVFMIE